MTKFWDGKDEVHGVSPIFQNTQFSIFSDGKEYTADNPNDIQILRRELMMTNKLFSIYLSKCGSDGGLSPEQVKHVCEVLAKSDQITIPNDSELS